MANVSYENIQVGDRVVCHVHAGIGRNGPEKKEKAGKVVMRSLHGGWVLDGGGKYGTPVVVDANNFVKASRK